MRVDQAIYGVVRNGHGLKCASGDHELAVELANRLDLPDTAPPGADWSPYVSGFVHRDRYILARTYSDPSASRAGMVLTHALICDREEIFISNDLRPLFQHLIASPADTPEELKPFTVALGNELPPVPPELADVARSLVYRSPGPVVRIGCAGFEDLVVALWSRLYPSLRRHFSFRLSFSPNDIVEQPEPKLVCTPASLIGRWQQHRIVGRSGTSGSLACAMLEGSDNGDLLRQFSDKIGAQINSFEDITLLEKAYLAASASPESISRLLAAIRLVEHLSPDPSDGNDEKCVIVDRLVSELPKATPSELLALRNVALQGFTTGGHIWKALEVWLTRSDYPQIEDERFGNILYDAFVSNDAQQSWRDAITRGIKSAAHRPGNAFQLGFWRWAAADPALSLPVITLVRDDAAAVDRLVETAPDYVAKNLSTPILTLSKKLKLFRLHAVVASASMEPADAALAQSEADLSDDLDAMRLAVRKAKSADLIDIADKVSDRRLLRIAGEEVAKTPSHLADHNMTSNTIRSVWALALEMNPESWRGPADPRSDFERLLIELIEDGQPPFELIKLLSASPLADLSFFARRKELWKHLSGHVQKRLLDATVDKWFERASQGVFHEPIEAEMEERVLSDQRLDWLLSQFSNGKISDGLNLIAALPGLDNLRFHQWVSSAIKSTRPINQQDAEFIGKSVAARRQRAVVGDLISMYRGGRYDLRPALRYCADLVSLVDRCFLGLWPMSDADKWESFVQVAAELYETGPDHYNLWERAGGYNSDLVNNTSGIGRWHNAVRQIQRGRPPRVAQLLREMQKDYENNQHLRYLADDPLFKR